MILYGFYLWLPVLFFFFFFFGMLFPKWFKRGLIKFKKMCTLLSQQKFLLYPFPVNIFKIIFTKYIFLTVLCLWINGMHSKFGFLLAIFYLWDFSMLLCMPVIWSFVTRWMYSLYEYTVLFIHSPNNGNMFVPSFELLHQSCYKLFCTRDAWVA